LRAAAGALAALRAHPRHLLLFALVAGLLAGPVATGAALPLALALRARRLRASG
jgi:hypothetical protein